MKVLITAPLGERLIQEVLEDCERLSIEVERINELELQGQMEYTDCDVLICYHPFEKIDFRRADRLKAIILVSAGIDQIPDYLWEREDLKIVNNNGAYSIPIAEWILMCLLMGAKNYPAILEKQRLKDWKVERDSLEFEGLRVLFLGSGKIATEAAKRVKALNATCVGYRRTKRENPIFDETVYEDQIDRELSKADAVVVCLPYTAETERFLSAERIRKIKDGAILINIARGSIVDQAALIEEMKRGKFRFVALDVVEEEPLDKESPLWNMERLFLSTHTSWISQHRPRRIRKHITENLERFLEAGTLVSEIDRRSKY